MAYNFYATTFFQSGIYPAIQTPVHGHLSQLLPVAANQDHSCKQTAQVTNSFSAVSGVFAYNIFNCTCGFNYIYLVTKTDLLFYNHL